MRARGIKPGFFGNEHLGTLSSYARLLYIALWCMADREGYLEDRPRRIRAEAFPYDDGIDIEVLLDELCMPDEYGDQLVIRYEVEGRRYIWIPKFTNHQKPHQNEKASTIPPYAQAVATKTPSYNPQENNKLTPRSQGLATKESSACDQGTKHLALIPSSLISDSCSSDSCISEDSSLRSESSCRRSSDPDEHNVEPLQLSSKAKTKESAPAFIKTSAPYRLASLMRETLKANIPTLKEPDLQKWAADFDIGLRNDERMNNPRFVAEVIKWACSDGFWRTNIQSPKKLREKFDQLTAKMEVAVAKSRASPSGGYRPAAEVRQEYNNAQARAFVEGTP